MSLQLQVLGVSWWWLAPYLRQLITHGRAALEDLCALRDRGSLLLDHAGERARGLRREVLQSAQILDVRQAPHRKIRLLDHFRPILTCPKRYALHAVVDSATREFEEQFKVAHLFERLHVLSLQLLFASHRHRVDLVEHQRAAGKGATGVAPSQCLNLLRYAAPVKWDLESRPLSCPSARENLRTTRT